MQDEILYFPGLERRRQSRRKTDHTDKLAQAIALAAKKAGIYDNEIPLTGPQLFLLLDDMAEAILHKEKTT